MFNAMSRPAKPARFPAIPIETRPPLPVSSRPRSPSISPEGPLTPHIPNQQLLQSTAVVEDIASPPIGPDCSISISLEPQDDLASKRSREKATEASSMPRVRRQHKCSVCQQTFARSEHLIRHERSHRKERPFSCPYCGATFTRKDLVKRHQSRSHPELIAPVQHATGVEGFPGNTHSASAMDMSRELNQNTSPNDTIVSGTSTQSHRSDHQIQSQTRTALPGVVIAPTPGPRTQGASSLDLIDFESLMREVNENPMLLQSPSAFMQGVSDEAYAGPQFNFDSLLLHNLGSSAESGLQNSAFSTTSASFRSYKFGAPETDPAQLSVSTRLDGRLSQFAVSEERRKYILKDAEAVFSLARIPENFKIPSTMALERYITAFFDSFLIHAPCIHVPTFKAEEAQPSLLLAMAALGANYHEDTAAAANLHRAARLSILNQMEQTSFTSKGRPVWVLQSLYLNMAFGVWRSQFDDVQEALAFQSNLAHIVRYVSHPGARWVDDYENGNPSWQDWIELEALKRTKFVVYMFFNDLTMAYNVPPVLTNSEVDMDLPCDEHVWMAETAQAWDILDDSATQPFSTVLRSLVSPIETPAPDCSTFGSNIMLSALVQQVWQSVQVTSPMENLVGLSKLDAALQKWQTMAAQSGSQNDGILVADSAAVLRLAHVMLCLDLSRLKTIVCRQDVEGITQAMRTHCAEVQRSPVATKAALFAIHAFRNIVQAGLNIMTRTGTLKTSPQTYICWFDNCLFLYKWLQAIRETSVSGQLTPEEQHVQSLLQLTLDEVDSSLLRDTHSMHARMMQTWAIVFTRQDVWGSVAVLGAAMQAFSEEN